MTEVILVLYLFRLFEIDLIKKISIQYNAK